MRWFRVAVTIIVTGGFLGDRAGEKNLSCCRATVDIRVAGTTRIVLVIRSQMIYIRIVRSMRWINRWCCIGDRGRIHWMRLIHGGRYTEIHSYNVHISFGMCGLLNVGVP